MKKCDYAGVGKGRQGRKTELEVRVFSLRLIALPLNDTKDEPWTEFKDEKLDHVITFLLNLRRNKFFVHLLFPDFGYFGYLFSIILFLWIYVNTIAQEVHYRRYTSGSGCFKRVNNAIGFYFALYITFEEILACIKKT